MEQTKATNPEAAKPTKRALLRSPNFPVIPLDEAISKVHIVYQREKRAETTAGVILKHLGYREERSGLGGRVLSALRQYGLLEDRNGNYRISELAFNLLHLPETSDERQSALKEAAQKPAIFKEILTIYHDGLPSDETLKTFLLTKKQFNPDAVSRFVRVFRGTVELAKLTEVGYNAEEGEEGKGDGMPDLDQDKNLSRTPSGGGSQTDIQTYTWALSIPRNVKAELRLYGQDLRREDVDTLKKYLDLLEAAFKDSDPQNGDDGK